MGCSGSPDQACFLEGGGLQGLRENRAAPEGLGIFSHCTQHSAFGYVLGYDMSRLRRLIFAGHTPPAKMKLRSHADSKGQCITRLYGASEGAGLQTQPSGPKESA